MTTSFKSILSDIGNGLKKFFDAVDPIAKGIEPIVDIAFPGIGPLYNATVTEVANAEALAVAAGKQNGSGAQKLAAVVAAITPTFNAYAQQNKLTTPTQPVIENYVNAVVASLNAIPAATAVS